MIITRAPLRIPLAGGGTDFPGYYLKYGGFICSFALDRYVHVVLHDTIDKKVRLKYSKTEEVENIDDLKNRIAAEALKWYGYPSEFEQGIEIATFSDVPEASGLGGSSSFCVALVTALRRKLGLSLDKETIFASAYDIERNKAGQPGGIQDQYFAAHGGAQILELGEVFERENIDIRDLVSNLKLLYTGTGRANLAIAENQVSRTSKLDTSMLSNLDSVKAMGRTIVNFIRMDEYDRIGMAFDNHWEVKKLRDPSISNPTIDSLYTQALNEGAKGGKLIGLGGGGYLLMYTDGVSGNLPYIPVGIDQEGCKVCYET